MSSCNQSSIPSCDFSGILFHSEKIKKKNINNFKQIFKRYKLMYGKIYQEWTILNFFLDNKNNHEDGKHYLWIYFF